ncbi:MAG TPA: hypothetical protein VJB14_01615 [Planctomycetota bacterium]|nr:hypothetical protein [Planctomycetota bacterium]
MSAIDTVYEYAGYTLAGKLQAILGGVGLPLLVALAGVAYTVHTVTEKGSVKELAVYFFYLIFASWLLSSTSQQGVTVPRFLAYLGRATDTVQKRAATAIQKDFLTAPFEWERIAAMVGSGRVTDLALEARIDRFLEGCAKVALAREAPRGSNLFRPGALSYSPECERLRAEIWARLETHVKEDGFHRQAVEAAARRDPSQASAFRERYFDRLCERAVEAPGSPTSEAALVAASLGEYSAMDPAQATGASPLWAKVLFGVVAHDVVVTAAVSETARMKQDGELRYASKQQYYLATVLGPHLYGLSLMVLLGLFPVAGLFAILPGKWRVLVNYGKVFASVKLWPVCWATLTAFNARRSAIEAFDPSPRGSGDVFFAVAALYLLTPAISFLVVHLATAAAAMPFAQAVPPPAGAGVGPAGAAVTVALRSLPK